MAKASIKEALWRAILDDREDDLPRLAYADLLEEDGDEARARFIRLQGEQAKVEEDTLTRLSALRTGGPAHSIPG